MWRSITFILNVFQKPSFKRVFLEDFKLNCSLKRYFNKLWVINQWVYNVMLYSKLEEYLFDAAFSSFLKAILTKHKSTKRFHLKSVS